MLRKFTKVDIDAVADAFDKYGFLEIQYMPKDDIMYIIFQTGRSMEEMEEAVNYLKGRVPFYNWYYDKHGAFHERVGYKRENIFIVSCYGWGEEVTE